MNKATLKLLDILIIISFFALLYILIKPQYQNAKVTTKERKLHSNMYTVKAAIERYRAFHEGKIPFSIDDIFENMEALKIPVNPYTETRMSAYQLNKFFYDVPSQIESTDTNGFHADLSGNPGEIMIGYYKTITPKDTVPLNYAIIGLNSKGKALTVKEGEKVRIVVLEE